MIGSRRELFTDRCLISSMTGLRLRLHEPQMQPLSRSPLRGTYITILADHEIEGQMSWNGHPELGKLAGCPVRIRFIMKEADLYSLRFVKNV